MNSSRGGDYQVPARVLALTGREIMNVLRPVNSEFHILRRNVDDPFLYRCLHGLRFVLAEDTK